MMDDMARGGGTRSLDEVKAAAQAAANAPRGMFATLGQTGINVITGAYEYHKGYIVVPRFDTGALFTGMNRVI